MQNTTITAEKPVRDVRINEYAERRKKKHALGDRIFSLMTFGAAALVLLIIIGIAVSLFKESLPAMEQFGLFSFMGEADWVPNREVFGGLRPLMGTLLTTIIALVLAVPLSLGIAVFLTELCPHMLRGAFGASIELLAAIPSIIYGMWGLFTLAPLMETHVQPLMESTLGQLPLVGAFFRAEMAGGVNVFTAGVVLSIMVVPFVASIARDTFTQTPKFLKESAYGVGATRWEVVKDVIFPYSRTGVYGGIVIALGRALGETMAVAFVIGNSHDELNSILDPYTTITSVLANEFNEASGMHLSSLYLLALVLFLANFFILALAKYYVRSKTRI